MATNIPHDHFRGASPTHSPAGFAAPTSSLAPRALWRPAAPHLGAEADAEAWIQGEITLESAIAKTIKRIRRAVSAGSATDAKVK